MNTRLGLFFAAILGLAAIQLPAADSSSSTSTGNSSDSDRRGPQPPPGISESELKAQAEKEQKFIESLKDMTPQAMALAIKEHETAKFKEMQEQHKKMDENRPNPGGNGQGQPPQKPGSSDDSKATPPTPPDGANPEEHIKKLLEEFCKTMTKMSENKDTTSSEVMQAYQKFLDSCRPPQHGGPGDKQGPDGAKKPDSTSSTN